MTAVFIHPCLISLVCGENIKWGSSLVEVWGPCLCHFGFSFGFCLTVAKYLSIGLIKLEFSWLFSFYTAQKTTKWYLLWSSEEMERYKLL